LYNIEHDFLVLCPLQNIFTFSTFILNYTTISLIFATHQFMIYSSSYFITDLFHFSLYLLKYRPTFCSWNIERNAVELCTPIDHCMIQLLILQFSLTVPWEWNVWWESVTSAFVDKPRQTLQLCQHYGKHCSCHLQGGCILDGGWWCRKPCIGQAVGSEWGVNDAIQNWWADAIRLAATTWLSKRGD
jgi:hypothetical protein